MSAPYDPSQTPPAPVLPVRLAAPGEAAQGEAQSAFVDTGADGTLVPISYLEAIEAIAVGEAVLRGVLGEVRPVHLFEVDLHCEGIVLPGMVVVGDEANAQILLGRNVLNRLVLLLDGLHGRTDWFASRPRIG